MDRSYKEIENIIASFQKPVARIISNSTDILMMNAIRTFLVAEVCIWRST